MMNKIFRLTKQNFIVDFLCGLMIIQLMLMSHASAFTSELTGDELVGFLQDSNSIESPLKRSLAKKISAQLLDAGLSFTDIGFSISDNIPGIDTNKYKIYGGSWSANLDGSKTSVTVRSNPGQVGLDINLEGVFLLSASGAARPLGFIPAGWRHVDINGNGNFQVKLNLSLDASFVENTGEAYALLGQHIAATSGNPLSGDLQLSMDIDVGTTSDLLTGSIVELFIEEKIKPRMIELTKEALQAGLSAKNKELRSFLPLQYRIPTLQELVTQISDNTRRVEIQANVQELLKKPLIGNVIEHRFQELAFYILTDNRTALLGRVCDFTQGLQASMLLPVLYSNAQGSCGTADLLAVNQNSTRFFSDASCATEVPFKPTYYLNSCSDLLEGAIPGELLQAFMNKTSFKGQPNTKLGNAANWIPDSQQPNDPLPLIPSQAWSLAHGAQMAITTEPLAGKTIPFMKKIRYRETMKKISGRVPIYRGCLTVGDNENTGVCMTWGYGRNNDLSTIFPRQLVGYTNSVAETGTGAIYYGCTDVYQDNEGGTTCTNWGIRENSALSPILQRNFLGYVNQSAGSDKYAVYENCSRVHVDTEGGSYCEEWTMGEKKDASYPSRFIGNLYKSDQMACQLEMRVYKKDLGASNLKPLLAFHGGSWESRGVSFIGLESQLAHYTEQGFVVFAPFYRLSGQVDGNPECNGAAWTDVVADAEAALDWVKLNAVKFGSDSTFPAVMGQSAGAHLAGWLMTYRSEDVSGGLLLYPPTDFIDLLTKYKAGYFLGTEVKIENTMDILSDFIGTNARLVSTDDNVVSKNSFAHQVSSFNRSLPPIFLLHGMADSLVPVSQSIVMCNAYGGSAVDRADGLRSIYTCGTSGQLHLMQQGEHGMDSCLTDLGGPCLAGDLSSRNIVADSLRQAREWLWQRQKGNGINNVTELQFSSSVNTVQAGEDYIITVKVSGNNPTGTVTFTDDSKVLGVTEVIDGKATVTISFPTIGTKNIVANYAGDGNHPASSNQFQLIIQGGFEEQVIPVVLQLLLAD